MCPRGLVISGICHRDTLVNKKIKNKNHAFSALLMTAYSNSFFFFICFLFSLLEVNEAHTFVLQVSLCVKRLVYTNDKGEIVKGVCSNFLCKESKYLL